MAPADYSLYLVTDRSLSRGRPTAEIVRQAVQGGVTCVQLRDLPGGPAPQAVQAAIASGRAFLAAYPQE